MIAPSVKAIANARKTMIDYKYKTKPFSHQDEDFKRSRDMDEYALFWEMGLGKRSEEHTSELQSH